MIGHNHSSIILNNIYQIMDEHETKGMDLFDSTLLDEIINYLTQKNIKYQAVCSEYRESADSEYGEYNTAAISFIDNGFPYLVMYAYKY